MKSTVGEDATFYLTSQILSEAFTYRFKSIFSVLQIFNLSNGCFYHHYDSYGAFSTVRLYQYKGS